jgi:phospholipid/cholesterol/gamma-HCH transport system substrate-binding protein
MESYTRLEIVVGVFVLLGLAALGWLSVSIGGMHLFGGQEMPVHARFATVGALKEGAAVKLAGVPVGQVKDIQLQNYAAEVTLGVRTGLELPADTIASIRTEGLLGEAYVNLSPGASEENLKPGGRIGQTEPPVDLMELLSRYAFGSVESGPGGGNNKPAAPSSQPGPPLD